MWGAPQLPNAKRNADLPPDLAPTRSSLPVNKTLPSQRLMAKPQRPPCVPATGLGLAAPLWGRGVPLTVLHLGAELALLGVLEDGVVAGVRALHCTVAAGLVKEGAVPTRGRAARQGHRSGLAQRAPLAGPLARSRPAEVTGLGRCTAACAGCRGPRGPGERWTLAPRLAGPALATTEPAPT